MSMCKKLITRCTSGSPIKSSSCQAVLDDDDLLTSILLHVPGEELMSLKRVSRKWHSVITDSHFIRLLRNSLPLRASGLFIQLPLCFGVSNKVYFVPLDDQCTPSPFRTKTFAHDPYSSEEIRILQSCNGLLLCSTGCVFKSRKRRNYVYNPSTNVLATLPKHPRSTRFGVHHIGLSFNPSKSVHYKVIAFLRTSRPQSNYVGDFHIYSSETGTWKASVQSFTPAPGMNFLGGVYWNGCVHWLSDLTTESEPESSLSDCLYFNVEEERLKTFPRPPIGVRSTSRRSLYFGQSEDHLHVIEICPGATSLNVYEMKNDYSEWFVKYEIDLDPISKVFPEMKEKAIFDDQSDNEYAVAVLLLIRRESFLEDSFLVLEIPGKAIRYNLVDRSFELILDFAIDSGLENVDSWAFGELNVWQYIESLSCV